MMEHCTKSPDAPQAVSCRSWAICTAAAALLSSRHEPALCSARAVGGGAGRRRGPCQHREGRFLGCTLSPRPRGHARLLLSLSGKLYLVPRATTEARELNLGAGGVLDPRFSPDGKQIAFVRDDDVWVYDFQDNKVHRLTTGGTDKKTHGLAEFVAQEE